MNGHLDVCADMAVNSDDTHARVIQSRHFENDRLDRQFAFDVEGVVDCLRYHFPGNIDDLTILEHCSPLRFAAVV